ncbi:MAG TPA: hypothetical protein VK484_07945, partial [Ferruginibacter sp.]|nr:hypothetical protein [Ferruginibacter sp.]
MRIFALGFVLTVLFFSSCTNSPASSGTVNNYDDDVLKSVIANTDSLKTFDFVDARVEAIKNALQQQAPVLLCGDSLNSTQNLAQEIALRDTMFTKNTRDAKTNIPFRNEIFAVYPARESDLSNVKTTLNLADCYRVEMYNYPLNLTTVALIDIKQQKVITSFTQEQTQPEIPLHLKNLAIKIAINSSEVQEAYGIKPSEKDALMASTKTSLNRTRCERSRHLCVAPTFVKDGKALWTIVDLTDHKLVGVRWTNVGTTGPAAPMITERRLQDDKITACFCEKETPLEKDGWKLNY